MRNLRSPMGRAHKAAVTGAIAVMAMGMSGCGSNSPASGGSATTAPTTVAAPATTAAPAATTTPPTSAATTTTPASSTTTSTTVPAPARRETKVGKRYKAIIDGANAAGTKFAPALDGYETGKVTLARFKSAVATYVVASHKLQAGLGAVRWPASVEPLIRRIVAEDKRLVNQLRAVAVAPRSKLKAGLTGVSKTLIGIHALSDRVRKDLGLPLAQ